MVLNYKNYYKVNLQIEINSNVLQKTAIKHIIFSLSTASFSIIIVSKNNEFSAV